MLLFWLRTSSTIFNSEIGQYLQDSPWDYPMRFRMDDMWDDPESILIDFALSVSVSNTRERLFWDDIHTKSFEKLIDISHIPDSTTVSNGQANFAISDARAFESSLAGVVDSDLLLMNVSNWKDKDWSGFTWDDITDQFSFLDPDQPDPFTERDLINMDISGLYSDPYIRNPATFKYLEIPIYMFDALGVDNVTLDINYENGDPDSVFLNITDEVNPAGFFYHDLVHWFDGSTTGKILSIDFDFRFNTTVTAANVSQIGFGGIALYTEQSCGQLLIETDKDEGYEYTHFLIPTPFGSKISPQSNTIDLELIESLESVLSISVLGSYYTGLNDGDMELYSLFVFEENKSLSEYEAEIVLKYQHTFDAEMQRISRKLTEWYAPTQSETITQIHGGATDVDVDWIKYSQFDYTADGIYDVIIQEFDGEGIGEFDNNRLDSLFIDGDADGIWDIQFTTNTEEFITQVSDPTLFDLSENLYGGTDPHYYLTKFKKEYIEVSVDSNGDGAFDEKYETSLSQRSFVFTEYRQYTIIDDEMISTGDLLWYPEVKGIAFSADSDNDGIFESSISRTDNFINDDYVLDDMYDYMIYETYTSIENGLEEYGNSLLTNETFYIAGPDTLYFKNGVPIRYEEFDTEEYWDGRAYYNRTKINGEFIVIQDIQVPIDPRIDMEGGYIRTPELLSDLHGTAYWYDKDKDGYFETAFIFTEESAEINLCIGIYTSRSGTGQIFTNSMDYIASQDTFLPTYWLSGVIKYDEIKDQAFADEEAAYAAQNPLNPSSSQFIQASFYADVIAGAFIQGIAAGISTYAQMAMIAKFGAGGPVGWIVGLVTLTVGYTLWNYIGRAGLQEYWKEHGMFGYEEPKLEFGTSVEDEDTLSWWDQSWQDLADSFTYMKGPSYFTSQLHFRNSLPWWDDTVWQESDEPAFDESGYERIDAQFPYLKISPNEHELYAGWWAAKCIDYREKFDNYEAIYQSQLLFDSLDLWLQEKITAAGDALQTFENSWDDIFNPVHVPTDFDGSLARLYHGNFWRGFDECLPDNDQYDIIGQMESQLAGAHSFKHIGFDISASGNPILSVSIEESRNISDPIDREIDFLEMCMTTAYWYERNRAQYTSVYINLEKMSQTFVHVVAGVIGANIGGFIGRSLRASSAFLPLPTNTFSSTGQLGSSSLGGGFYFNLGQEVMQEFLIETIVSNMATAMGACSFVSEQLGEILGGAFEVNTVVNKFSGTVTTSEVGLQYSQVYSTLSETYTQEDPAFSSLSSSERSKIFVSDPSSMSKAQQVKAINSIMRSVGIMQITERFRSTVILKNQMLGFISQHMAQNIDKKSFFGNRDKIQYKEFPAEAYKKLMLDNKKEGMQLLYDNRDNDPFIASVNIGESTGLPALDRYVKHIKASKKGYGSNTYIPFSDENAEILGMKGIVWVELENGDGYFRERYAFETIAYIVQEFDNVEIVDPITKNRALRSSSFGSIVYKFDKKEGTDYLSLLVDYFIDTTKLEGDKITHIKKIRDAFVQMFISHFNIDLYSSIKKVDLYFKNKVKTLSLRARSIKSDMADLYVSSALSNTFYGLLESTHVSQIGKTELINKLDYFNKDTINTFFKNDKGEIKNEPTEDFYVNFLDIFLEPSREVQSNYLESVFLGAQQYYKALDIGTDPYLIQKFRKNLGTLDTNVGIIRYLNKLFPALDLGLKNSRGMVIKEGGAAKKYFSQLFKYEVLEEIVDDESISIELITEWERLILNPYVADTQRIMELFKYYVDQCHPSLSTKLFVTNDIFSSFARKNNDHIALFNIMEKVQRSNRFRSPFSGKNQYQRLSEIINDHYRHKYYENMVIFNGLNSFVEKRGKALMTLPQFSALYHFDFDTFKTFLLFSKSDEQALEYYNAWQKALAESDVYQLPDIDVNAPGYTANWNNRDKFEQVLYDLDKGMAPLSGKMHYFNMIRMNILSKLRTAGLDEPSDVKVWLTKNAAGVYGGTDQIPATFGDETFRKILGKMADVYSIINQEYRRHNSISPIRTKKRIIPDIGALLAVELSHGSKNFVLEGMVISETLDQTGGTSTRPEFEAWYILQKDDDGFFAIINGYPYYAVCKNKDARLEIERMKFHPQKRWKINHLGSEIPLPTHSEISLIAKARKMDVSINVDGESKYTTTLGFEDIMLNLDKILVQNTDLLAQFKGKVNSIEKLAHDIQMRFGIIPGVGDASGRIGIISRTITMPDGSTRTYRIDTKQFWLAYRELTNVMYTGGIASVLNHGHFLFEILRSWNTHPQLVHLIDGWDIPTSSFDNF